MYATNEWQPYDYDYEKDFQDIRTKDGTEYVNCYPNAGTWVVLSSKNLRIKDEDVTHVKLTAEKDLD